MITITLSATAVAWVIGTIWLILGFILCNKQTASSNDNIDGLVFGLIFVFAPLVLIGAIIRQVFIEKWK